MGPKLVRPFSEVLDEVGVTDTFIRNWLSLLCFLLQGMKPDGTQTVSEALSSDRLRTACTPSRRQSWMHPCSFHASLHVTNVVA